MEIYTELEIDTLFNNENNLVEFEKFLKTYGIDDSLEDVTLKHTKKRLETLLAIAEEGTDPELIEKKDLLKKLLDNLKDHKEKREAMKALREVYSHEALKDHMDLAELDKTIKHSLREYKKYEHFKKHEQKIADKWIKTLSK
ncbi:MAG: hypothetical protein ACRDCW_16200 [Sarcina sp.]